LNVCVCVCIYINVVRGWLGLILGTRMWYPMWGDADQDDEAAFERRIDGVVREIGDRGKLRVADAVSLEPTPTPAPAPAPAATTPTAAPAPTPTAAPAPAPAPPTSVSTLDASRLALERDSLMQQVQQLSSQLASVGVSATLPSQSAPPPSATRSSQLSESFYLERERAERQADRERAERAERQAQAERQVQAEREKAERAAERAERTEARLIVATTVGATLMSCTCGLGAAIIGATVLLKKA
jgi:type IV secretory pathway VirB10-like protein